MDQTKKYGFMPGCSLSAYNPKWVLAITEHLKESFKDFSLVHTCCGKPTISIGQEAAFDQRFSLLEDKLNQMSIDILIVACQNCKKTISTYKNSNVEIISLWEVLPKIGLPKEMIGKGKDSQRVFTIHDSCPTRFDKPLQDGVRWIVKELGYKVIESEESREKTRCCGSGGMVLTVNPELGKKIAKRRIDSLVSDDVIVYCASCRGALLTGKTRTWHLLDLIFGQVATEENLPKDPLASPLKAWGNRWKTKKLLKI